MFWVACCRLSPISGLASSATSPWRRLINTLTLASTFYSVLSIVLVHFFLNLFIYSIDIRFKGILVFAADFLFVIIYVNAAQKLHQSMLGSILKCTMQFFESTPVGRILNRFSKDVDVTETRIPDMFKTSVRSTLWVVSVLVVICFNTPVFIIFLVPIFCFYFFVQVNCPFSMCSIKHV